MNPLIKLCLFHSIVFVSCKYSANIPDITPDFAKDILEFAKKYRYRIEYKHGIRLFRTNETLNVSSEYQDSPGEECFAAEVNSSYEVDDTDLSTAMSWMDGKTTPRSVEKMTLNISDYHFNIDKQFAHQIDYDFNDSFPVASQQYSDDGIMEPIARNYFVKRNESYFLKEVTDLFSSYERQFLPPVPNDLEGTNSPPKTTKRNFSKQHSSNPYKRLFRAINTELFEPYLSVGTDEVTQIDFPTTLTVYREPFFVYVHRLTETNVTFYHNQRKYYFRGGTMIRDLDGLKYFVPNYTFPSRNTRQTRRTKRTTFPRSVTKRKANVRSKMKSAKTTVHHKYNSIIGDKENTRLSGVEKLNEFNVSARNRSDINLNSEYSNHSMHSFLVDKLGSLVTTTEPSTTRQSSYIQPLFTVPCNKHAYIRVQKPDPNLVTFIIKVKRNCSYIFVGDKRSLDPNILASSVIYANSVKSNKEWDRNFEHLNMNLFGRHRNHAFFTSTTPGPRTRVSKMTTTEKTVIYNYESSVYIEML